MVPIGVYADITTSSGTTSTDFGGATYKCPASANNLMVATAVAAVSMSALVLM